MNNAIEPGGAEEDSPGLWKRFKSLFNAVPKTTEDMVAMVGEATKNEIIDDDAKRIIEGALEVSEKQARDIMVPRTQMTVLKASDSFSDNLAKIIATGHSRYPVVGETIDDVLGLLLTKDLLGLITASGQVDDDASTAGATNTTDTSTADTSTADTKSNSGVTTEIARQDDIINLLRAPVFVPESKRLNILLRQFREARNHMALVIDEYGGLAGLVTIEDVLEEIVGEIEDEHDYEENKNIRKISSSHFVVNALTPIEDFNAFFQAKLEDDEFDTIGGIVTNNFGHLPKRNEQICIDRFTFHVMQADTRRLRMLRMTVENNEKQQAQPSVA